METAVAEKLFDLSDEYEAMLNQGIRLSGEGMLYFVQGRLRLLQSHLASRQPGLKPGRILDFGCGIGDTSQRLREMFPQAEVTGIDTSEPALATARERHPGEGLRFMTLNAFCSQVAPYDLCYVNGVFHHIPVAERPTALHLIHRSLRPGGMLALFENNPWNPGARMVMARIPFDRDAEMLSPRATANLLRSTGFDVVRTDSLFFFPRLLRRLRFAETLLGPTRLGAQYLVLGSRR